MKIALIGWSGNHNWGDERMFYCIKKFFAKHKIVRFKSFLDAILNIDKVNSCDYVLIGGGGLVFRGFSQYVDFLNSITRPLGCIGISIESDDLSEDMIEGLELLKKKADFIYVRDEKSAKILKYHHKVIVGPDIAFLYPYSPIPVINRESVALNLRNWFWWDLELNSWLHIRMERWEKKYPLIKLLYPFRRWSPDKFVLKIKIMFKTIYPLPFYFGEYDKTDYVVLRKYFSRVPKKYDISLYKKSRYLVGMRLHSLIFATQIGMPFISLTYEPKNINYCISIGHPELSLNLLDYKKLPEKIRYLRNNYAYIREDLLAYSKSAQNQANYIFNIIEELMIKRIKNSKLSGNE